MAKMEVGLVYDFKRKVAWKSYRGGSYGGTQVRGGGCKTVAASW